MKLRELEGMIGTIAEAIFGLAIIIGVLFFTGLVVLAVIKWAWMIVF